MLALLSRRCLQNPTRFSLRTFLSEAYQLKEAWNSRLGSPILQKINLDSFFYELDLKFNQNKKVSAIDIDIFANKVTNDTAVDELSDVLFKLRKTEEATNILDSTSHAFIRNMLDHDLIEPLIQILDNRLGYGIFLDDFTANLVLDQLLKSGRHLEAARVATIQMTQEDFSNPITRALSLLACIKYVYDPEGLKVFDDLKPKEESQESKEAQQQQTGPKKKKKPEEIKIRVRFLRNPYFDDHFDLRDSQHLVGKTLWYIGRELQAPLGSNIRLLGLALYQKYDRALKVLGETKGTEVYKPVVDKINELLGGVSEEQRSEDFEAFKTAVEGIGSTHKVVEADLEKMATELCQKAVANNEANEIEQQKKVKCFWLIFITCRVPKTSRIVFQIYSAWIEIRQKKLEEEIERLTRVERLKNIEKLTEEMKAEEQRLWFFENEEKIDLAIEDKRVFYRKRWFGKKKTPRVVDENYVPPEIEKRRKA